MLHHTLTSGTDTDFVKNGNLGNSIQSGFDLHEVAGSESDKRRLALLTGQF